MSDNVGARMLDDLILAIALERNPIERGLPDGRIAAVRAILFGRARLAVRRVGQEGDEDEW